METATEALVKVLEPVSSEDKSFSFVVTSSLESKLKQVSQSIKTLLSASQMLPKYGFQDNLNQLDGALSPILAQGSFQKSDVGRLALLLADLLSMLTNAIRRGDEITTTVPQASLNFESVIQAFSAPDNLALDSLIDLLQEKGYDRALDLLESGDLSSFFPWI